MNNDKELVDKCWEEYTSKFDLFGNEWHDMGLDEIFKAGFEAAKRSQPSVVLTNNAEINHLAVDTAGEYDWNTIEAKEKYMKAFTDGALMICDDIARRITAAGIKYTIGE